MLYSISMIPTCRPWLQQIFLYVGAATLRNNGPHVLFMLTTIFIT